MTKAQARKRLDVQLSGSQPSEPWPATRRCERTGAVVTGDGAWLAKMVLPGDSGPPTPTEIEAFLSQVYAQRRLLGYAAVVDRLLEARADEVEHAARGVAIPRFAQYALH